MTQLKTIKPIGSYCDKCDKDIKITTRIDIEDHNGAIFQKNICTKCAKKLKKIVRNFFHEHH